VHEAYLRLAEHLPASWENRAHFYAVAARAMREILVDHARRRTSAKRWGGLRRVTLAEAETPAPGREVELVALDRALDELATLDPQQGRIVELRFFGGLTIGETGDVLGISVATANRRWTSARAWLFRRLSEEGGGAGERAGRA
jgi:RNA polymerase sigma factor (TIGR02999 family)